MLVTTTSLTESDASGATREMMFLSEEAASILISTGVSIVGELVSIRVTIWVALAEFPEESSTDQVTTVSPNENVDGASLVIEDIDTKSDASA